MKMIEDAYQAAMRVEENMFHKQNQRNRGKSTKKGRGTFKPRFQHSQNEAGSSSNRSRQRGDSSRERVVSRCRGQGRDVR